MVQVMVVLVLLHLLALYLLRLAVEVALKVMQVIFMVELAELVLVAM